MAEGHRMTAADLVDKLLTSEHADVLRESVAWLVTQLMDAEVGELTGAGLGERAPDRRQAQRNGYRAHLPAAEDQHPIKQLTPNGADPPLCVGIRTRRPHRSAQHLDPLGGNDRIEPRR